VANLEHLAKLQEGVEPWNQWRKQNPEVKPDLWGAPLSGADLREVKLGFADLTGAYLNNANLSGADLWGAVLIEARLSGADLREANLSLADLSRADLNNVNLTWADLNGAVLIEARLFGADLSRANLFGANLTAADLSKTSLSAADLTAAILTGADLSAADLSGADLTGVTLVNANLEGANLTACRVYGISAWNVRLEGAIQKNLVITPDNESPIQVDNLEVAQFIYLLLRNEKIRSIIDTITSKVVLILGSFKDGRKEVLDAIRDELRKRDYLPVLFDFEKPASRNLTETVSTLAHMARFVIADITDAKSIPQELMAIVPNMPSVPVQPLLLASQQEYGMFEHFRNFPWVLEEVLYDDQQTLLAELSGKVIAPAEAKAKELVRK
jgi:uncharacterized protein YjbI with pentapeptide repeats